MVRQLNKGVYDLQIVAIALSHNMTLLTNNIREFERVKSLKLENWVN
jgi:tRNA(fMet)-specific endonuclease VapC